MLRRLVAIAVTFALSGPAFASDDESTSGDECLRPAPPPELLLPPIDLDCRADTSDGVGCWPDGPSGTPRPDAPPLARHRELVRAAAPAIPPPHPAWIRRGAAGAAIVHPGYHPRIERPPR